MSFIKYVLTIVLYAYMFTRMCICSTGTWSLGFAQNTDVSYLDDLLTRCGVLQAPHSSGDANICRASICTYRQAQVSRIGDSSRRGNRPILASSPVDCLASSCYLRCLCTNPEQPRSWPRPRPHYWPFM